jgi:hypothetical protein
MIQGLKQHQFLLITKILYIFGNIIFTKINI